MTPTLRAAIALYADARLHEEIAEQFDGTGEAFFDSLVQGHKRSAELAYRQADRMVTESLNPRGHHA